MKLTENQLNEVHAWLLREGFEVPRKEFENAFLFKAEADPAKITDHTGFMSVVMELVCDKMNVNPSVIRAKTRLREIVRARQIFSWIVRMQAPYISLESIGKFLGGKDHATILYSKRTVTGLAETDKDMYANLEVLCQRLAELGYFRPQEKLIKIEPLWLKNKSNSSWTNSPASANVSLD